jgi:hypothetical protein
MNELKPIEPLILTLRGQRVILDADLAEIYGVPTKRLNEQVKRNVDRFPADFMLQLTVDEWSSLRSQFATLNEDVDYQGDVNNRSLIVTGSDDAPLRSQSVTLKDGRGQHRKYMPYAFTEHGAIMAATVLNSPEAVAMSVFVVRAFVLMRERLAANAEILRRLAEIDKTLLEHNGALAVIWEQLQPLLTPPPELPRKKIGFDFYQEERAGV